MSFTHTFTNLPEENEYPKLVRDRIPEIVKEHEGVEAKVRVLDEAEFETYVRQKVIEEAHELAEADTDDHVVEEIADVQELLDTLCSLRGVTHDQLKKVQLAKRDKRGGFDKRLLMLRNPKQDANHAE